MMKARVFLELCGADHDLTGIRMAKQKNDKVATTRIGGGKPGVFQGGKGK